MDALFERFESIHFILSFRLKMWQASMSPAEFDSLLTFLTNIAIFDDCEPDPSTVLVIHGAERTGKTTLANQIWALFPRLSILETMEQQVKPNYANVFIINLKQQFFSQEEYEKYFSMKPQPLLMGNCEITQNFLSDF